MRVLVISPHPDDEAVGCGGALRVHARGGDEVRVVFVSSGEQGGHGTDLEETAAIREGEAAEAAAVLGIAKIDFWREPDGRVRVTRQLVSRLTEHLRADPVDLVYVPHAGEQHDDHRAAARLVRQATAALPPAHRPTVRSFEVWTPLATMHAIVDISEVIEDKLAAIRCYRSQVEVLPFDEAFRGLARYRGAMHSWPGGPFAEVFLERN